MDGNLKIDGRAHLSWMDAFITGASRDDVQRRDAHVGQVRRIDGQTECLS